MKVVYINDNDLLGRRFNGYDLQKVLNKKGIDAKQLVVAKASKDRNVDTIFKTSGSHFVRQKCREFEERMSIQSLIYPFGESILTNKYFVNADIVHYHLIFNHFLSLYSFKKMVETKPSVWTLHDPWALTGHCVHPIECKGWLTGCKKCDHLDRYSPLLEDNASSLWNIKRDIYKEIDLDIVVASEWMHEMVKASPLTQHFKKVHVIPFGINLSLFKRSDNRENIRSGLGLKTNEIVLMFRQDDQEFKGLNYIKDMLRKLKSKESIVLLSVGKTGLLNEFANRYKIIEYGWIDDEKFLADIYSAADIFLMPSIAESFGLMAVEAMASSLPVVVFKGTALPGVTFSPNCSIALDVGDTEKFVNVIERLIKFPEERRERGEKSRRIAEKYYNIDLYNNKIIQLYESIYRRRKKRYSEK